jgi:hypothetical protein
LNTSSSLVVVGVVQTVEAVVERVVIARTTHPLGLLQVQKVLVVEVQLRPLLLRLLELLTP